MKKVTEQNKELESVAGGKAWDYCCLNCDFGGHISAFSPKRVDSGCSSGWEYTCPVCGYSWVN